jgi:predicted dithiol-disulfide oxidoreductase (DUF899 family)
MKVYQQLCELDNQISALRHTVEERRREIAHMEVGPYSFIGDGGQEVSLSELFGNKQDLLVVHNMGRSCDYCTLWADVLNGMLEHIEQRTAFALVSPDDPATQQELAGRRGWKIRMVSGRGSSFTRDMGFEDGGGDPLPGVSSFHRSAEGSITRVSAAPFGEDDEFCAVWRLFDLLKDGSNGWTPS